MSTTGNPFRPLVAPVLASLRILRQRVEEEIAAAEQLSAFTGDPPEQAWHAYVRAFNSRNKAQQALHVGSLEMTVFIDMAERLGGRGRGGES